MDLWRNSCKIPALINVHTLNFSLFCHCITLRKVFNKLHGFYNIFKREILDIIPILCVKYVQFIVNCFENREWEIQG